MWPWRLLTVHREDLLLGSQSIANHLENQHEPLEDCALLWVSKQCKLHPPYWVIIERTNFFFFVPNYLGVPVITKYFIKICLFVSWAKSHFFSSSPLLWGSLTPRLHEHFYWSLFTRCRYGKYLLLSNLFTLVTVFGVEQVAFQYKVIFWQTSAE